MKKWIKIAIFLLIVILLVVGAVRLVKKRKAQEASTPIAKEYAVIVKTLKPQKSHVVLSSDYLAIVKNDKNVALVAKFPGRILQIKEAGQKVKKGDVVAKIDTTVLKSKRDSLKAQIEATRLQIAAAKEALVNLRKIHERTKKLYAVKGASKEQLEREATQIANAKANLASLRGKLASFQANLAEVNNELSYAVLTSPIDGVVAKKFANLGDIAMPGRPLLSINGSQDNYLLVRLPSNIAAYGLLYNGKRYALKPLKGSFNSLSEYRADVDDPKLIEGQRVETKVITYDNEALLLPFDAVLNRNGKTYVLVVNGEYAKPLEVHVKASGAEGVVVAEDLSGKELVVAKPDILLKLLSGIKLKEIKG
ncbi:efflux RND transporter periplasmic adaptor subunit [Nitratiruptor sp. YY09-18]|uniref:efflux RND transporter periplasmic adaptor subunit n=1 Tax=Nitratiruptor sp. YY09-18 TaxID=2724901 RepID=UPI0019151606|nr:biotin/lipoyl-binding protein [Nitratiruptor sp. YY09-18]BCD67248.1 efflux transporter, RND family, MFP subunit [Nitratiruptor sp. YY09-18]